MATNLTLMQQFLTLFDSFAHSALRIDQQVAKKLSVGLYTTQHCCCVWLCDVWTDTEREDMSQKNQPF